MLGSPCLRSVSRQRTVSYRARLNLDTRDVTLRADVKKQFVGQTRAGDNARAIDKCRA